MKHNENSETEQLIERAFERDLNRLPKPQEAPSAHLLNKLAAGARPAATHSIGLFGSAAAKWIVVLTLGSVAAGIAYFTINSKPDITPNFIQPSQHSISESDSVDSMKRAVQNLKHPVLLPLAKPVPHTISKDPLTSSGISEDSLLREKIAHPTVTQAPDSARTTIHQR